MHGDLCGPVLLPTLGGKCYYLLFVDDHNHFTWIILLLTNDKAVTAITRFKACAEVESGRPLCTFQMDQDGEFTSPEFTTYRLDNNVQHHLNAPYSPQRSRGVER